MERDQVSAAAQALRATPKEKPQFGDGRIRPVAAWSHAALAIRAELACVGVAPASLEEVAEARALAARLIGGRMAAARTIARIHRDTGAGLFIVRGDDGPRGLLAFVLLSAVGARGAANDRFGALRPPAEHVARGGQEPAAIYSWAIAAADKDAARRLIEGHERLRHAAVPHLPFYARMATDDGRRLGIGKLGFKAVPGSTSGLYWSQAKTPLAVEAAA